MGYKGPGTWAIFRAGVCLWTNTSDDSDTWEAGPTNRDHLKGQFFLLGSHIPSTQTVLFIKRNPHKADFLKCRIHLAHFLSTDPPPGKYTTMNVAHTHSTNAKTTKQSCTVDVSHSEVSSTFYFACHWLVALKDQHLYPSLQNVQAT